MKKIIAVILLAALVSLLASCTPTPSEMLSYQSYPFSVKGSVKSDGREYELSVSFTDKDRATVTFDSPETLSGYIFNVTPDGITLTYGDLTVPYHSSGIPGGDGILTGIFSLSAEQFSSCSDVSQNGMTLRRCVFSTPLGDVVAFINSDSGEPVRFEAKDGEFIFNVSEYQKAPSDT